MTFRPSLKRINHGLRNGGIGIKLFALIIHHNKLLIGHIALGLVNNLKILCKGCGGAVDIVIDTPRSVRGSTQHLMQVIVLAIRSIVDRNAALIASRVRGDDQRHDHSESHDQGKDFLHRLHCFAPFH